MLARLIHSYELAPEVRHFVWEAIGVERLNFTPGQFARRAELYHQLGALTGAGLLRRIEPQGSVARYEARVGDNHHHVVCRSCGVVADVDCAVAEAPCLSASDSHGFSIDEAEVTYWGLCPDCQDRRREDQL